MKRKENEKNGLFAGGTQSFMIKNGIVFATGNNGSKRLGIKLQNPKDSMVVKGFTECNLLPKEERFVRVSSGANHTLFLTENGKCYGCGTNSCGQLALNHKNSTYEPTYIFLLKNHFIVQAEALFHSLFLTRNGKVFSAGSNFDGRCGQNDSQDRKVPTEIQFFTKNKIEIIQICAGGYASLFLDKNGVVYGCGNNVHGELGQNDKETRLVPTEITFFVKNGIKIKTIETGYNHTLFISTKGVVFSAGYNGYGQLGHGDKLVRILPTKIELLKDKKINIVSAGDDHSVFASSGKLFSCGKNRRGQCAVSGKVDLLIPVEIKSRFLVSKVVQITCGFETSLVRLSNGYALLAGCNSNNQLGIPKKKDNKSMREIHSFILNKVNLPYSGELNFEKFKKELFRKISDEKYCNIIIRT